MSVSERQAERLCSAQPLTILTAQFASAGLAASPSHVQRSWPCRRRRQSRCASRCRILDQDFRGHAQGRSRPPGPACAFVPGVWNARHSGSPTQPLVCVGLFARERAEHMTEQRCNYGRQALGIQSLLR